MKSYPKQLLKGWGIISLFVFFFACRQKGGPPDGSLGDSTARHAPVTKDKGFSWTDSIHGTNAVRVDIKSPEHFDWNAFRNKFHKTQDSGVDFSDEVAVGPWVSWNEYEYRRVYRFMNDTLWIQTFYRSADTTGRNTDEGTVLLDSQEPDYIQFGPLWSDMLTRGHHLTDSLQ